MSGNPNQPNSGWPVQVGASLLRQVNQLPDGCYCEQGKCQAPKPNWCRDHAKRDANLTVDMFPTAQTEPPDPVPEKEKRYRVPAICVLMHKHGELFPLAFKEWLPVNLHIWHAFQQQAVAVFRKGFKHYSARTIVHVLRHHSALNETGGEWKINNNHSPSLARLFDLANPHMKGMFEFREFYDRSNK